MKSGMNIKALGLGTSLLLLSGCGMFGGGEQADVPASDTWAGQERQQIEGVGVGTYEPAQSSRVAKLPGEGEDARRSGRDLTEAELRALLDSNVVYFDFDDTTLRDSSRSLLVAHANYLSRNLGKRVMLAGHADERGTREYNMALGEKRAITVRNFLLANGVDSRQLETVSYGEEKPADAGSGELAWGRNRRVELLYQ